MSKPDASECCLSCGSSAFQVSTIDGRRMCRICPATWPAPTEAPAPNACGSCRWSAPARDAVFGDLVDDGRIECRHRSPEGKRWAKVFADDWCGDYLEVYP